MTYTEEEVRRLLLVTVMFSGANGNQGLSKVKGDTYGDKVNRILSTFNSLKDKELTTIISSINK